MTPAGFVGFSSPALLEDCPAVRGAAEPIPQYCDLALGRPYPKRWAVITAGRVRTIQPAPPARDGIRFPLGGPPILDAAAILPSAVGANAIAPSRSFSRASVRLPRPSTSPEAPWIADGMQDRGGMIAGPARPETMAAAASGFEIEQPQPAAGASAARSTGRKQFPLYPVWLAALFALPERRSIPRRASECDDISNIPLREDCRQPELAAGPGFSGLLEWPAPGAVYWEFRETWSPTGVIESGSEAAALNISSAKKPWEVALRYWRAAPALARGMAMALPLIVPVVIYAPTLLGTRSDSPASRSRWDSFLSAVQARASIDIQDGFGSGFDAWTGADSTWSSESGSARPGRLALLRDSIPLTNYRLAFVGQIESKALSVAFRASDLRNYQAGKLIVVKPGPLPSLAFVHYPVINGVEGPRTQTPTLTMEARPDTLYKVVVTVEGDHFSVSVNGQFVTAWSDDRLKSGGIGFFADQGERARVIGVHVIENEDVLGRICYQVSQWTADRRRIGAKDE